MISAMTAPQTPNSNDSPKPKKPWYKKWWVWMIIGVLFIGAIASQDEESSTAPTATPTAVNSTPTPTPEETEEVEEEPTESPSPEPEETQAEEESPSQDVEYLVLDDDQGGTFVTINFPVREAFTNSGIIENLKSSCVDALQEVKREIDWWDHDKRQCMGFLNSTNGAFVGGATFSVDVLWEISDTEMSDDPEAFWELAEKANITTYLQ